MLEIMPVMEERMEDILMSEVKNMMTRVAIEDRVIIQRVLGQWKHRRLGKAFDAWYCYDPSLEMRWTEYWRRRHWIHRTTNAVFNEWRRYTNDCYWKRKMARYDILKYVWDVWTDVVCMRIM